MRAPANQPVTHHRYEAAMRHAEAMRHYAISLGRSVDAPRKTAYSPNIAIASLIMDPADSNVLYAGTGEGAGNIDAIQGLGILKTADAGVTSPANVTVYVQ
jgi:hypothetical protein